MMQIKPSNWADSVLKPVVQELKSHTSPPAFDSLTRVATAMFDVPVALISIIDELRDRQVFASQLGLDAPWSDRGETPLSHSFCQHVKNSNTPLIVSDAREHPLVCENLAIRDLNVIAYLGQPVHDPGGNPLGALCVIDARPRKWSARDEALLGDLAVCVSDEIRLRSHVLKQEQLYRSLQVAHERLKRYAALNELVAQPALAPGLDLPSRLRELVRTTVQAFGFSAGHLALVEGGQARILARMSPSGFHQPGKCMPLDNTLAGQVMQSGRILSRHAGMTAETRTDLTGAPARDYAAVPIQDARGQSIGVIELTGPDLRATPLDVNDETVLGIASMFAAMLLEFSPSDREGVPA